MLDEFKTAEFETGETRTSYAGPMQEHHSCSCTVSRKPT
jgi:hypothetical protein